MTGLKALLALPSAELNRRVHNIGNTPIKQIRLRIQGRERAVNLKLESENPTGSMKDRTGYGLIRDLEEQRILGEGSTIIESTSGNLGAALALICKVKGYNFVAVVDPKTTEENISKMEALGAKIERVSQPDVNGGYLLSRLARVEYLCSLHQNYVWTNQYKNASNPRIHYMTTASEMYRQMDEQIDAVFIPVSTGGTLAGVGRFFREVSPATRVIGVDAHGSVVFGTPSGVRQLTGIGSSRSSNFLQKELYDTYMLVRDEEAFAFCRTLYAKTKIKIGGSSGCVLFACACYLQEHPEAERVVCLCADSGENYNSSIYHDGWIQRANLELLESQIDLAQDMILAQ